MAYCAWCRKWGRTPVVTLTETRHVVIGDGVDYVHSIALTPVVAGKTICARHQTITTADAKQRMAR